MKAQKHQIKLEAFQKEADSARKKSEQLTLTVGNLRQSVKITEQEIFSIADVLQPGKDETIKESAQRIIRERDEAKEKLVLIKETVIKLLVELGGLGASFLKKLTTKIKASLCELGTLAGAKTEGLDKLRESLSPEAHKLEAAVLEPSIPNQEDASQEVK